VASRRPRQARDQRPGGRHRPAAQPGGGYGRPQARAASPAARGRRGAPSRSAAPKAGPYGIRCAKDAFGKK